MTDIILLECPDGKKYRATLVPGGAYYVERFLTQLYPESSEMRYYCGICTTEKIKEQFTILAATKTDRIPNSEPIHDAWA